MPGHFSFGGSMADLTNKQQRFVEEYLVDLNATAAAGRAGYSDPNYGRQLITKPNVAAAVQAAIDARSDRTEITADRVLKELARVGFADMRRLSEWGPESVAFVPSDQLTEDEAAIVSGVKAKRTRYTREDGTEEERLELELKTYDKVSALREMGKHLGIADRLDLRTPDGIEVRTVRVPEVESDPNAWADRYRGAASVNGKNGDGEH